MDCISCKGKHYQQPLVCGKQTCPIYSKTKLFKSKKLTKQEFLGTPPTVFVGRFNYPKINVGIVSTPEETINAEIYDDPRTWGKNKLPIEQVVDFRSSLINSRFQSEVKYNKDLETTQLIALAEKPVDTEFSLTKKPHYNYKSSQIESPMGATGELKQAKITANPKINQKVDYIFSDTDLKSNQGLNILYSKGFDETFLTRILSVGTLGVKKDRKLVPTRWSITAVDDTIGKNMIEEVKKYPEANPTLFQGSLHGNYYYILLFPKKWSYELFETYLPKTLMNPESKLMTTTDHEFYEGRKGYAQNCQGGYYACRLAILDKLNEIHRQSSIIVLRFITEEYHTHLGVWVCREATRIALNNKIEFSSYEELLKHTKQTIKQKFNIDIEQFYKQSKLIDFVTKQRSLFEF
jgi:DNA repair protein NreA